MTMLTPSAQRLKAQPLSFDADLSILLPSFSALTDLETAQQTIKAQEEKIKQLESLAMTDSLTGLMNRRAMTMILRRELAATRRDKRNAGFLMAIDIDGFKALNERYGRAIGDSYLQTAASVLLNEVRGTDFVARMGDDSFAILMPQIAPRDAAPRMDRLENVFNKRVMHHREHALALSASFGFALLNDTTTAEAVLIAADAKLYASKARRKMGMA